MQTKNKKEFKLKENKKYVLNKCWECLLKDKGVRQTMRND